ncbi:MAG TPA: inositol monophosphatase family protein [Gemmataceae bacterium]|nr:inositol monophosphatase family protein [Gemmataceae bacterium]
MSGYLDCAKEAARRGATVLEEWRSRFQVQEKGRFDLVTQADVTSQRIIREFLTGNFPQHDFIGEEDQNRAAPPGPDAPPTWIVDPLDGTTNYVHDCPMYSVSIGLQVAGELVVGVVLDPSRPELFAAAKGLGAWLNQRRLQTSSSRRLEEALLATGFPPDLRGQEYMLDWFRRLSLQTQSLRRTGSTALNLAYVAAGRFDGFWGFGNQPWDVAAGVVLVREAGGTATNLDGSLFNPFTPDALVSNGPMHPVLVDIFRKGL